MGERATSGDTEQNCNTNGIMRQKGGRKFGQRSGSRIKEEKGNFGKKGSELSHVGSRWENMCFMRRCTYDVCNEGDRGGKIGQFCTHTLRQNADGRLDPKSRKKFADVLCTYPHAMLTCKSKSGKYSVYGKNCRMKASKSFRHHCDFPPRLRLSGISFD